MGYVCIHGHFYQPPRENPWLEAIELQDSAYPYHDWNERVTAECYAPNSAARILDDEDQIVRILNNYEKISFNFGPTLLSWIEGNAPRVYKPSSKLTGSARPDFPGTAPRLRRHITTSSCPWQTRVINTPRSRGGSGTSHFDLTVLQAACGFRKPRSISKHWKSSRNLELSSRFWLQAKPAGNVKSVDDLGRT